MTYCKKWQIAGFEAVTGRTRLEFSENSTLLKIKQDIAEDRTPSIRKQMGIYCQLDGHLMQTSWASNANKLGKLLP